MIVLHEQGCSLSTFVMTKLFRLYIRGLFPVDRLQICILVSNVHVKLQELIQSFREFLTEEEDNFFSRCPNLREIALLLIGIFHFSTVSSARKTAALRSRYISEHLHFSGCPRPKPL